jgi:hypothetical protein
MEMAQVTGRFLGEVAVFPQQERTLCKPGLEIVQRFVHRLSYALFAG